MKVEEWVMMARTTFVDLEEEMMPRGWSEWVSSCGVEPRRAAAAASESGGEVSGSPPASQEAQKLP